MTWPRPEPAELTEFYSNESYFVDRDMGASASQSALDRARDLASRTECARAVLDFGAGEGHLVNAFRTLGVRCEGVEPSEAGRQAAERLYGLKLRSELDAAHGFDWDLVTLVHSLEHVRNPLLTLSALRARLVPGGYLFIEVPHAGSIEMWRRRERQKILDLPAHLYHFTPDTLVRMLEGVGFNVIDLRLANCDLLEWFFALRASRPTSGGRVNGEPERIPPHSTGVWRQIWRGAILPWLRRMLPGWKFQIVARKSQDGGGISPS